MARSILCFLFFFSFQLIAQADTKGEVLYRNSCEMCHGISGRWEGAVGAPLKQASPKLKNFDEIYSRLNASMVKNKVLQSLNSNDKNFQSMHEQMRNLSNKDKQALAEYFSVKFTKK